MSELTFIHAYASRFEAEQAQQYLIGQGIQAMVQADDGGGAFAGFSLSKKGVRLLVHADDAERARDALLPGEVIDTVEAGAPGSGSDAVPAPLAAADAAVGHFDAGHNCAEAVLRAFADDRDQGDLVRLASGFGGGMGGDGNQCGALSGGVLVMGLWLGRLDPDDKQAKERIYAAVRELLRRFAEVCGEHDCRDLTGVDLTTDQGAREFESRDLSTTVCRRCVREAAHATAEIVAREVGVG